MTGNDIRQSFINFFENKGHKYFESASLIPDDKSLLLTVAGMVPFKPFFLGEKEAPFKRITTCQKCIRTNDLDNVGKTARHQTFFEMLGNFSFGDYFKVEAIEWSWEYVTEVLKLDKDKLWVSVFKEDDEAYNIWRDNIDIKEERIVRLGEEDNWWAAGPVGSCGPCSEIYYDTGKDPECTNENCAPGCDCNRFLEIWNLVFTEWNRLEDGSLIPLPEKNIDTGAGLERIASIVQNKETNFDTDLLYPILEKIKEVLDIKYNNDTEYGLKVITDHLRASVFLIGDGVLPSNEGRGYILRKLIRRAYGVGITLKRELLDREEVFLNKVVKEVVNTMKYGYKDLEEKEDYIKTVIEREEDRFSKTLKHGIELLNDSIEEMKSENKKELDFKIAFKLYDTYGFPFEFTKTILENNNLTVSEQGYNEELEKQKERSQTSHLKVSDMVKDEFIDEFFEKNGKTNFVGYEDYEGKGIVLYVEQLENISEIEVIFNETPFYAESGGQVADTGFIESDNFRGEVLDVQKKKDIFIHKVKTIEGMLKIGDTVNQYVDEKRRKDIQRNHTATHLLHKALREELGTHVEQSGSLVDENRLRFDFSHYESLDDEIIRKVEKRVNQQILKNRVIVTEYMSMDDAKSKGAMALFGDKYGSIVRVVDVPGYSVELCGGTHVKSTGEIGLFNIEQETGIASGVRRITATTGYKSLDHVDNLEEKEKEISKILKADRASIIEMVNKKQQDLKDSLKEIEVLKSRLAKYEIDEIFNNVENINGVDVLLASFKDKDNDELKEIVDTAKNKMGSGVVLVGSNNGNAVFLAGVTEDLTSKIKAGQIVKEVSQIADGNGGGRPDFAQAGGKDGLKVKEAIDHGRKIIKEILS